MCTGHSESTPEDVLHRILGEGETRVGENLLHVEADLEVSDDEVELILEILDEIRAIRDLRQSEEERKEG